MEMASEAAWQPDSQKHQRISRILKTLDKKTKSFQEFWTKFNNDWSWNNAAGLAFNLILSIFPLVIALLALIGFFVGRLDPVAYHDFTTRKLHDLFPAVTSSQNIIQPALRQLTKDSGILGIFAIIVSIMVLASSLPAIVSSLLQKTPEGLLLSVSGIVSGLIGAYVLFQVIYMVVPNQKISFRKSWRGAVVAAFLLELYLVLFPLYVTTFLGSFASAVGVLILLIFFYYFAIILFLGAEVIAFFVEGVRSTPYEVPTMIHVLSSHLPTSEQDVKEQAAADHKDEVPKDIRPKRGQSTGQSTRAEKRA